MGRSVVGSDPRVQENGIHWLELPSRSRWPLRLDHREPYLYRFPTSPNGHAALPDRP